MIFSVFVIIFEILLFFLILIAVMGLLHLIEKCCKINLPKWLKWNKDRTIISIVIPVLIIAFLVSLRVFRFQIIELETRLNKDIKTKTDEIMCCCDCDHCGYEPCLYYCEPFPQSLCEVKSD